MITEFERLELNGEFHIPGEFSINLMFKYKFILKGTLMQICKISLYVWVHIKIIPWKFGILNPKKS